MTRKMNKYNDHIKAIKNNYPTSGYSALCEAYELDYVDLADLDRTIMEETGVTLLKKREGKY